MIQIEKTPNPNSLKFMTERTVSSIGAEEFKKRKEKINNSFVKEFLLKWSRINSIISKFYNR